MWQGLTRWCLLAPQMFIFLLILIFQGGTWPSGGAAEDEYGRASHRQPVGDRWRSETSHTAHQRGIHEKLIVHFIILTNVRGCFCSKPSTDSINVASWLCNVNKAFDGWRNNHSNHFKSCAAYMLNKALNLWKCGKELFIDGSFFSAVWEDTISLQI